jgi:hypothetical protein
MLLKLVNDISSIKATLQSNHTLRYIDVQDEENNNVNKRIQQQLGWLQWSSGITESKTQKQLAVLKTLVNVDQWTLITLSNYAKNESMMGLAACFGEAIRICVVGWRAR